MADISIIVSEETGEERNIADATARNHMNDNSIHVTNEMKALLNGLVNETELTEADAESFYNGL